VEDERVIFKFLFKLGKNEHSIEQLAEIIHLMKYYAKKGLLDPVKTDRAVFCIQQKMANIQLNEQKIRDTFKAKREAYKHGKDL
jgi:hypothetical protein